MYLLKVVHQGKTHVVEVQQGSSHKNLHFWWPLIWGLYSTGEVAEDIKKTRHSFSNSSWVWPLFYF